MQNEDMTKERKQGKGDKLVLKPSFPEPCCSTLFN